MLSGSSSRIAYFLAAFIVVSNEYLHICLETVHLLIYIVYRVAHAVTTAPIHVRNTYVYIFQVDTAGPHPPPQEILLLYKGMAHMRTADSARHPLLPHGSSLLRNIAPRS